MGGGGDGGQGVAAQEAANQAQLAQQQQQLQAQLAAQTNSAKSQAFASLQNQLPSLQQLEGFAPQSFQSFGAVPYVQASQMNPASMTAAQVDQSTLPGALSQFQQLNTTQMQPTFDLQNQQLQQQEASRGIFNSGAAQQMSNDLAGHQASALASMNSPLVQAFANYYQQNQQSNQAAQQQAAFQNAGWQQEAGSNNMQAQNAANAANASTYGNIINENMQAYNAYEQALLNAGIGQSNGLINAYMGSFGANPQATGILGQGVGTPSASLYAGGQQLAGQQGGQIGNAIVQAFQKPAQPGGTTNNFSFGAPGGGAGSSAFAGLTQEPGGAWTIGTPPPQSGPVEMNPGF